MKNIAADLQIMACTKSFNGWMP